MKFDKARNLVKLLLAMCLVFCLAGLFTSGTSFAAVSTVMSLLFFVVSFVVIALYCKCPNCGKHIYLGLFKAVNCPRCKRNLITGAKSKGKKR